MAHVLPDLEGWNPMAESYHDANINSYEHGPRRHLMPYARTPGNSNFQLYVDNIPVELTESSIRQVFDGYGRTTDVVRVPGTSFAYVTFGSFREAECAIRALNDAPPLELRVTFAKPKAEGPHRNTSGRHRNHGVGVVPEYPIPLVNHPREYISPEPQPLRPLPRILGPGQEFAVLAHREIAPPPQPLYGGDDLLYPDTRDPTIYNPYEAAEPFAGTNTMWPRERLLVSNNGTKFVTMGRGHPVYELPAPHPKVNQQIRAVFEIRKAGLYEYEVNKFPQQVGKCQYCTKLASMRCQRCREYYCSRLCQEADWPRHKIECQSMLRLEAGSGSGSLSLSSGDEVAIDHGQMTRTTQLPMRRPKTSTAPISTSTPLAITLPESGTCVSTSNSTPTPLGKENHSPVVQAKCKRAHSGDQKRDFASNKPANTGGWNPTKGEGDNSNFILRKSRGQRPPVEKNSQHPKQENKSSENISGPNRNSSGPGQRSQYQSNGNEQNENYSLRGGRCGNSEQRSDQLVQEQLKTLNINDKESAKPVDKANCTKIAEPVGVRLSEPDLSFVKASHKTEVSGVKPPSQTSVPKSSDNNAVAGPSGVQSLPKPPNHSRENEIENIVQLLDVGDEGFFEIHVLLGGKKAAVTVCTSKIEAEFLEITNNLTLECDKLPSAPSFKPSIGDLACGRRLDDWIRGTVTSLGPPVRLAAIDEGRVESVTAVRPIPSEFVNLPKLGVVFELTEGDFELQSMQQYLFKVEKCNSESVSQPGVQIVLCFEDGKEGKGKGFLKPWTPAPEQKGIPLSTLTSGTKVCIASFRSHASISARSLVPKDSEIFDRVTQDVAKWSTKASPLTSAPIAGEIVIAKYEDDGNFYRAIVRKIVGNKVTITYIDFGNTETTTLKNIRSISPKLKEYPCCVVKIVLKDVPEDVAMTKGVSNYLGQLAGKGEPLMCTFDGSPLNGVILKAPDGTCVNDKINELLIPSWKKKQDKTTVFMIEDVEVAELGKVGQTITVLVLYSYGALSYAMGPQDSELIEHINCVMSAQIEEYCNGTKEHYIPRKNEFCLAPFEGQWYRAVCAETNTTPTASSVQYVDFGNVELVEHTDLRLMTKDFTSAKILASICSVVGLGSVDAEGKLPEAAATRVSELVPPNKPVLVKIVACTGPGEYTVELPEVRDILVKEGLIRV